MVLIDMVAVSLHPYLSPALTVLAVERFPAFGPIGSILHKNNIVI
jgi:hypothetical protein